MRIILTALVLGLLLVPLTGMAATKSAPKKSVPYYEKKLNVYDRELLSTMSGSSFRELRTSYIEKCAVPRYDYEKARKKMEKNPTGMFGGGLEQSLRDLTKKYDRQQASECAPVVDAINLKLSKKSGTERTAAQWQRMIDKRDALIESLRNQVRLLGGVPF